MLFNSVEFMFFFPFVTTAYFILPHRFRWLLLLLASCFFYMSFFPIYILILLITIIIDYIAGLLIEGAVGQKRKVFLLVSIASNVLILAFFKYFNFFNCNASALLSWFGIHNPIPYLNIILPIGLSFHTFQAMSYTIEVYKGRQKAEHHFGIYALYVMFYPQLVAGPIERPQNLLHQFYEKHTFDYYQVTNGLKLMAWGFFKKLVIADRLSMLVSTVYSNPVGFQGIPLIMATIFFAFQIYCDFSGYSDIALGCAQVMGFSLMQNFDRPYLSLSISEFWRRWHISLTTWFKDYVYIPLGGNRVSPIRRHINLFTVFLISGLWHGANWTFVVWGALNGLYLVVGAITKSVRMRGAELIRLSAVPRLYTVLKLATTFMLICFTWIFFRANSLSDAFYIVKHLFSGTGDWLCFFVHSPITALAQFASSLPGIPASNVIFAIILILLLMAIESAQKTSSIVQIINTKPLLIRWFIYYVLLISILLFGVFSSARFIYFQF